jgi:hypothetical protein
VEEDAVAEETPIAFEYFFVADSRTSIHMARMFVKFVFLRPRGIAALLIFCVVVWLNISLGMRSRPWDGGTFAIVLIAFVAILILALSAVYISTRRRFRPQIPAGAALAIGFGESIFRIKSPTQSSEIAYSAYDRITVRDRFVLLRRRNTRFFAIFPIELFPGDRVEFMRAKIAQANATQP